MPDLQISCPQCDYVWVVPKAKKGGQVNCPACGLLTEIKGASDTKHFYGLVGGLFALLGLPLVVSTAIGLANGTWEWLFAPEPSLFWFVSYFLFLFLVAS